MKRLHCLYISFAALLVLLTCAQPLYAQHEATLSGTVVDSTGKALQAVNVGLLGSPNATSTNELGFFKLTLPADSDLVIGLTFVGLAPQQFKMRLKAGEERLIQRKMVARSTDLADVIIEEQSGRKDNMFQLDPKSLQVIPNPTGNIESILKTLPGVSSSNELSSQYNVRGGNFDENLVYVNDIEIYRPFLIRSGQQEGLSFVNSDMVSSLTFSAGGFDAKYGDKLSSVLDIQYIKPTERSGIVSASLLGANLALQGLNRKKTWTYLLGARQKSNQYILKSLDTKGDYKPSFTDIQFNVTHDLNKHWELAWLGNYSHNKYIVIPQNRQTEFGTINEALRLTIYFDGSETDSYETTFGAFKATNKPNDRLTLKYILSGFNTYESETFDIMGQYYIDELERDFGKSNFGDVAFNRGVGTYLIHARNYLNATVTNEEHKGSYKGKHNLVQWGLKAQQEWINDKLNEWTMIDSAGYSLPHVLDSAGYSNASAQPDQALALNQSLNSKISLATNRYSGFVQNTCSFNDSSRFSLTTGVRFNYWDFNKQTVISPRGALFYHPHWKRSMVFRASVGVYYQPPFYKELRDFEGQLNSSIKAQQSIHYVLGADYYFKAWNRPFKYAAEVYYKELNDIIPYKVENVRIRYFAQNNAKGYAQGIDMRLNGEFVKGVESWASLSVMQAMEDISNDFYVKNYNSDNVKIVPGYTLNDSIVRSDTIRPGFIPRPADQRVNFGLFFQDYLPKFPSFKMHMTLLFGTGLPFGPPGKDRWKDVLRMPPYRRVDIGFSKQILGGNSKWNPKGKLMNQFTSIWLSAEVFNLLGVSNTVSYLWVTDVTNRQYAVPNYLTSRQLNVRLNVKF